MSRRSPATGEGVDRAVAPVPRLGVSPPAARADARWRRAAGLGALCFVVYLTNLRPVAMWSWDSIPARLLPFTVLRQGNVDFDEFHWLFRLYPRPYFLHQTHKGHWLSAYALGVGGLVTPLSIPAVWWLQHEHIDDDDVRFRLATVVMERVGAALYASVSVSLMLVALYQMTSPGVATAMALAYAFGTSVWTVGSQTLLQHGAAAMTLAALSYLLLAPPSRRIAVAAGGCAALAVLMRPTMVLFSLLALLFMWRERRRQFLAFVCLPLIGMCGLFAYNAQLGGLLHGGYHRLHFFRPHLRALMGLLVSPNRGLFIYTPAALLVVPIVWQRDRVPPWVRYLPFGVLAYWLLYGSWEGWWGGNTFGPRFLTDALPAMVLCAVPTVERLWRVRGWRPLLLALVAWGVVVQALGVYWDDNSWNDRHPGHPAGRRVWDWSDWQIARAARSGWNGTELAPLLWQALTDPHPARLVPLSAADLAGEIATDVAPTSYPRNSLQTVRLRVTNHGTTTWPAFSDYGYLQCKIGYRWLRGRDLVQESGAIALPRNLAPGETATIDARVWTPPRPGTYALALVLVQVRGADNGLSGGAVLHLPVRIE